MAWIESHQTLGSHPKLLRLSRMLSVSDVQAVGHLHYLWWWCLDYAQGGDVSRYEAPELATAAHWDGDPAEFVAALERAGFLDKAGTLHDWYDYAGKLIERREKNRERMRQARNADTENTCRARAGHVQGTCGATVPNPTIPNHQGGVGGNEQPVENVALPVENPNECKHSKEGPQSKASESTVSQPKRQADPAQIKSPKCVRYQAVWDRCLEIARPADKDAIRDIVGDEIMRLLDAERGAKNPDAYLRKCLLDYEPPQPIIERLQAAKRAAQGAGRKRDSNDLPTRLGESLGVA